MFGANQPTGGTVKFHHCRGAAMQAQLVLQADHAQAVGFAGTAVLVGNELGHQKETDPLGARHPVGKPGQTR